MYSLNLYFVTKLLVDIPSMLFSIYVATTIVYLIVGLENTFSAWLFYCKFLLIIKEFIFTLLTICGYLIGICAGILCKQASFAIQASPLIVMPLVVFGGLVVNLKTIPAYSSWFQYITPIRYGYNVLITSQLDTDQMQHLIQYKFIREKLGLSGTNSDNISQLFLLCFGFLVLSFVTLYGRRKFQ
jgi:ABC-type multidrug transport system permease subunit